MARGRMLNQTVSASLKFQRLPNDTCRLLATWIIPHLDMNGVFYADPALVRSYIFPRRSDITTKKVAACLDAMEQVGLIRRFQARGDTWLWWPGFLDNQAGLRPEREVTSYPAPPALHDLAPLADPPALSDQGPSASPAPPGPAAACRQDAGGPAAACRQDVGTLPVEEKRSKEKRKEEVAAPHNAGSEAQASEPGSTAPGLSGATCAGSMAHSPAGAGAPPAGAGPAPRSLPRTFQEWKAALDDNNPQKVVRRMSEILYPDHEPPDYGLIAVIAKRMGEGKNGYHRLMSLLWEYAARAPQGDVLPYLLRVHQGKELDLNGGAHRDSQGSGGTEGEESNGARVARELAAALESRIIRSYPGSGTTLPPLWGTPGT